MNDSITADNAAVNQLRKTAEAAYAELQKGGLVQNNAKLTLEKVELFSGWYIELGRLPNGVRFGVSYDYSLEQQTRNLWFGFVSKDKSRIRYLSSILSPQYLPALETNDAFEWDGDLSLVRTAATIELYDEKEEGFSYIGRYIHLSAKQKPEDNWRAGFQFLSQTIRTAIAPPKLSIDSVITNDQLRSIFAVGNMGGMRRSTLKNLLVIVSDHTKGLYKDKWVGSILHYTGMGKLDDQDYVDQNKTLAESDTNGVNVHLFEVTVQNEYRYHGLVRLAGEPYPDDQDDDEGESRKVIMFPVTAAATIQNESNASEIKRIANELNARAGSYKIGNLQSIRKEINNFERPPSKQIFSTQTIQSSWAFHHGGRSELQFNIGIEDRGDQRELRHGVAFSFELSQTLPRIDLLIPKVRRFNEYLRTYPDLFADMRMWNSDRGKRSGDYAPAAILPEFVKAGMFVFLGTRGPTNAVDLDKILSDFDRLLPLYRFVETGVEADTFAGDGNSFVFRAGTKRRTGSTKMSLAKRELDVSLRHNLLQDALCKKLIAEYGKDNVADEHATGFGKKIDVVLRHPNNEFWYYEIKTATSARGCIREALGQILEYSYWPRAREAIRLIICGESRLDADADSYLKQLKTRFSLPVSYEQLVMPAIETSD